MSFYQRSRHGYRCVSGDDWDVEWWLVDERRSIQGLWTHTTCLWSKKQSQILRQRSKRMWILVLQTLAGCKAREMMHAGCVLLDGNCAVGEKELPNQSVRLQLLH